MKIVCNAKRRYRPRNAAQIRETAYFTSLNILALINSYLDTHTDSPASYEERELADAMLFMVQKEAVILRDLLRELDTSCHTEIPCKIAG